MYWAPIESIDRPNEIWNGCTGNGGGLCQNIHDGVYTIAQEIASGPIHVKRWGDGFIGTACGNWHGSASGPIPTIAGTKYEDLNGDSARQPGEPGLGGWTIDLSYGGNIVATTTTGPDGSYAFQLNANTMPINAGAYTVTERQQPGWVQSHAPDPVNVGYGAGPATFGGNDFGNYRPVTIQGRKFDDHAVDGAGTLTSGQNVTDADFGNVCLGKIAVTVPDGVAVRVEEVSVPGLLQNDPPTPRTATGTATINDLLPGTYRVTMTLPDGVFTTDPDLTSINGEFAVVKTVTVGECSTTAVAPVLVVSAPGKITGGIRIAVPGGFATGGFEFMQKKEGPRGTLEYNDHASGLRIHTSDITGISVNGAEAYVFGHALVGATTYGFRLHLVDAGEPGTSDRFELVLANGYTAGTDGPIQDGNIQVH
ncbi:post-COAP-1 domain-containing protein [Actinocrispum sp. NPDC049592]|uniref:post-COAP-1 domain-containing protein n=1 Tax=Actinocrispum sp. NPDC049592 TaxID=3154835 RepID=UPI003426C153